MIISLIGKGDIEFVGDRPGHDLRYSIDCTKAKDELGRRLSRDFERGIEETIGWYKEYYEGI